MTRDTIADINDQRLDGWKQKLTEHLSTAVMVIGVQHVGDVGKVHVLVTEDMSDEQVKVFLKAVPLFLENKL